MRRLAIYCVTYNSYKELAVFLHSVCSAASAVCGKLSVSVFVADNSNQVCALDSSLFPDVEICHFPTGRNAGYLGAVQDCMKRYSAQGYDFVIISNVDLTVDADAFSRLLDVKNLEHVGWLAPQIYSELERRDRNPAVMTRHAKRKLQILNFMYRHYRLFQLYEKTFYRRKRMQKSLHQAGEVIYAGHGSFMIFTRAFFDAVGQLDYPIFLFCEEIYLAELCRMNGLEVRYVPSVRIIDSEHCSTGKMHPKSYYRYNEEATRYILKTYYA